LPLAFVFILAGCGGGSSSGDTNDDSSPFALRGSIGIEANTRVDGDTSDRLSFGGALLNEPQRLPATFVLGGYVSDDSGSRTLGDRFDDFAMDQTDRFQVPFKAGEEVSVATFVEGNATPGMTLSLLDPEENTLMSVSIAANSEGAVTLPDGKPDGDYLVKLSAGSSSPSAPIRYVAMKVAESGATSLALDWPRHDYLPGRAIVSQVEGSGPQISALSQASGILERKLGEKHWLMRMADARMASAVSPKRETLAWIEELRRQPGVESAVPDYVVSAQSPVNEPLFQFQWHYDLIDAPTAWQFAQDGGRDTVVAVLDTGLFRDTNGWHPDLADNVVESLLAGSDFVDGDNVPADVPNSVAGSVFHGTHVSGTVSASGSNTTGGTGVAFNSGLLPVRVLGEGGTGSSSDLIEALGWIIEDPSPKAQVVNLSLGGLPAIQALQDVIDRLAEQNVIVVAAAGNQSTSTPSFPAAANNVFAVSAVDGAGNIASYSNFGTWVDLAAPGGDARRDANLDGRADLVISTGASFSDDRYQPDYTGLQGTSMAAPHVAGVFALMRTLNPELDYGLLRAFLINGDLTDSQEGGRTDALGYGVINAAKAVLVAANDPDITILSSSPSVVSLSSETNPEQVVELQVSGAETIVDSDIDKSIATPDWLSLSLQSDPLSLNLTLNEESLEPGVPVRFALQVHYTSDSSRTLEIPVVAQLVTDELARNAGQHFILLVNTEPDGDFFETEAQVSASVNDGQYELAFRSDDGVEPKTLDEVSPGRYFLVAGTDLDNDGVICQPGEACAEYPVSGLREVIDINENTNLTDIRMTTGFSRPGISATSKEVLPRPDFEGYQLMTEQAGSQSSISIKAIGSP
jgi:serine protease